MENYDNIVIPTFVVRTMDVAEGDRNIREQFEGRKEFGIRLPDDCLTEKDKDVSCSALVRAVRQAEEEEEDILLFCRDDIRLTACYSRDAFIRQILTAAGKGAQVLYGGAEDFGCMVPVDEGFSWVDWAKGSRMTVVYRPAFRRILEEADGCGSAEAFLSETLSSKFLLYPFIADRKRQMTEDKAAVAIPRKPTADERMAKLLKMAKMLKS